MYNQILLLLYLIGLIGLFSCNSITESTISEDSILRLKQNAYNDITSPWKIDPINNTKHYKLRYKLFQVAENIRNIVKDSLDNLQLTKIYENETAKLETIIQEIFILRNDKNIKDIITDEIQKLKAISLKDGHTINNKLNLIELIGYTELYKSIDYQYYKFSNIKIGTFQANRNNDNDSIQFNIVPLGLLLYYDPTVIVDNDTLPFGTENGITIYKTHSKKLNSKLITGNYIMRHNDSTIALPFELKLEK